MLTQFHPLAESHRTAVIDIINHYAIHSFATFMENPIPYEGFNTLLDSAKTYPAFAVETAERGIIGMGMLRLYMPWPTFSHTAEISYFLHPDACGQGIGSALLEHLLSAAKGKGITNIVAKISSENEASVRFHQRHNFTHCGTIKAACIKKGKPLDIIWMQRLL